MESLSERIYSLRKNNNLTQVELAEKINVSKSQFIRYETKDTQPPADVLNHLADVLNTTVDFLINGTTQEKAKANLKSAELLNSFKEIDALPDTEQSTIIKVVHAYIRDYKARQTFASSL
jgi:transcriptional regulator with XRE-family HTH domain